MWCRSMTRIAAPRVCPSSAASWISTIIRTTPSISMSWYESPRRKFCSFESWRSVLAAKDSISLHLNKKKAVVKNKKKRQHQEWTNSAFNLSRATSNPSSMRRSRCSPPTTNFKLKKKKKMRSHAPKRKELASHRQAQKAAAVKKATKCSMRFKKQKLRNQTTRNQICCTICTLTTMRYFKLRIGRMRISSLICTSWRRKLWCQLNIMQSIFIVQNHWTINFQSRLRLGSTGRILRRVTQHWRSS